MALTTLPTAAFATGSVGTSQLADGAVTTEKLVADVNFRNLIINGDMSIAQRGTSATTISAYDTIDRFSFSEGTGGTATSEQESLSLSDFAITGQRKAVKIQCTGTDTSIASGDRSFMQQSIEAQNLQSLKYGTSSAETLTLSFYAKSNLTGNFPLTIKKDDNTVYYLPLKYTITSANTWEKFTFVITPTEGSTSLITNSGGAINNDNGRGMQVIWGLVWGSNYTGNQSGTPTWTSSAIYADNSISFNNFYSSTDNNLSITGVQLEVGTSASDFEFLPYDVNLQRCQRYFYQIQGSASSNTMLGIGFNNDASSCQTYLKFPTTMRSTPSITSFSGLQTSDGNSYTKAATGVSVDSGSNIQMSLNVQATSLTVFRGGFNTLTNSSSSHLALSSEL